MAGGESMQLPPGFRFHPTDEEIISSYLVEKVLDQGFSAAAVGEVDLNKCEPWDLPSKAKMGEKEWYFFCQRDRKYPTGTRTNRATEAGYWKATGKDKEIYKGRRILVGMKKTLVFYRGRAPKGEKSNWVMHEYRLEGHFPFQNVPKESKDSWVVCRVFQKSTGIKVEGFESVSSFEDHRLLDSSTLPSHSDHRLIFARNQEGLEFKASTSMPSYYSKAMVDPQAQSKSFMPENYINYYSPANPSLHLPQISENLAHELHQIPGYHPTATSDASSALRKHCKAEQLSNQSMVTASHDAGLSPDGHAEISSIVSRHGTGGFGSFEYPDVGSEDLSNIWDY